MIIALNNKNINDISPQFMDFHDFAFHKYEYDYKNKSVTLYIKQKNEDYCLLFENTLCVHMQSCEPWGKSPYILSITCVNKSVYIDELSKLMTSDKYPLSQLESLNGAYAIIIEFASGSVLTIVCQSAQKCTRTETQGVECTGDGSVCSVD